MFYAQANNFHVDEQSKIDFANCCVSKVKEIFPDGFNSKDGPMSDSLKLVIVKMGADCAKTFTAHLKVWTPEAENQLKLQIYSYPETKLIQPGLKKEYVDCVAFKVMQKYQHEIADSIDKKAVRKFVTKARGDCIRLIANKYRQLKQDGGTVKKIN